MCPCFLSKICTLLKVGKAWKKEVLCLWAGKLRKKVNEEKPSLVSDTHMTGAEPLWPSHTPISMRPIKLLEIICTSCLLVRLNTEWNFSFENCHKEKLMPARVGMQSFSSKDVRTSCQYLLFSVLWQSTDRYKLRQEKMISAPGLRRLQPAVTVNARKGGSGHRSESSLLPSSASQAPPPKALQNYFTWTCGEHF